MAKKKDVGGNLSEKERLELEMTENQIAFCRFYIMGGHSNKECYILAYPNSSPSSAESNASRLLKNENVKKYINILLDELEEDVNITDKEIIRELKRIAFKSKNDNARIKSLQLLGEIVGLFGDKKKITTNVINVTIDDKQKKMLEDNANGQIIGASFQIIDDTNDFDEDTNDDFYEDTNDEE